MEIIPIELITKIAMDLPFENIRDFCQTASVYSQICRDPVFWAERAERYLKIRPEDFFNPEYFPKTISFIPIIIDPRQYPQARYIELAASIKKCLPGVEQYIDPNPCLRKAAYSNNIKRLDYFFNHGASSLTQALMGAAEGNHYELVKKLASQGLFNIACVLFSAAASGNIEILNYLLYPLKRPLSNKYLYSLSNGAGKSGNIEMIEYIISLGGSIEQIVKILIENRHFKIAKDYFDKLPIDTDFSYQDIKILFNSNTPLTMELINKIISKYNYNKNAIFELAVQYNNDELMNLMLSKGAQLKYGLIGAVKGNNIKMIQYFLEKGVNPDHGLIAASRIGNENLVNYFIKKGAGQQLNNLDLAIRSAIINKHFKLSDILLEQIKQIGHIDWSKILEYTVIGNDYKLFEDIINDDNIQINPSLAIIEAIRLGNFSMLKELIEHYGFNENILSLAADALQHTNNSRILYYILELYRDYSSEEEFVDIINKIFKYYVKYNKIDLMVQILKFEPTDIDLGIKSAIKNGDDNIANYLESYLQNTAMINNLQNNIINISI